MRTIVEAGMWPVRFSDGSEVMVYLGRKVAGAAWRITASDGRQFVGTAASLDEATASAKACVDLLAKGQPEPEAFTAACAIEAAKL